MIPMTEAKWTFVLLHNSDEAYEFTWKAHAYDARVFNFEYWRNYKTESAAKTSITHFVKMNKIKSHEVCYQCTKCAQTSDKWICPNCAEEKSATFIDCSPPKGGPHVYDEVDR